MNQNQVVTNNIVLNNYITFGNGKGQRNDVKKGVPQKDVPIDDLMSYFSTNYKNILPNRLNRDFDFKTMLFPFEKGQVVELLYQMDILIQLLVQVFFRGFPHFSHFSVEFLVYIKRGYQVQKLRVAYEDIQQEELHEFMLRLHANLSSPFISIRKNLLD